MNIEVSEASIVSQLQAGFAASSLPFKALPLPEADADFKRAIAGPIAFVVYTGSTSPGVRNTNPTTQDRKLQFSVEVFSRILRGPTGLYMVRDYVERILVGFKPANCDRLYLVKDDIQRGEDTIWGHILQFECLTVLVQDDLTDPIIVPSLKCVKSLFVEEEGDFEEDEFNDDFKTRILTP